MNYSRLFFSTAGRIGRQEFWTGLLAVAFILVLLFVIIDQSMGATQQSQIILFVIEVVLAYPLYAVMAKRFQDRGRPGIYAIAGVGIPLVISLVSLLGLTGTEEQGTLFGQVLGYIDDVVAIWILIDLGIMPGTPGPNAFGPDPLAAA